MAQSAAAMSAGGNKGNKSVPFGTIIGVGALAICGVVIAMDIQASESYLLQSAVQSFSGSWNVLRQPYDFMVGNLDLNTAKSVAWGWGVELVYFMCVVGWGVARDSVEIYNRKLVGIMRTVAWAIVILNTWTTIQYGHLGSGIWGQIGFGLLTSLMSVGLPLVAAYVLIGTYSPGSINPVKKHPVISVILGACLIIFGGSLILLDVQSSEAFITHTTVTVYHNSWNTLRQPWDLVSGVVTDPNTAIAIIWGWGGEFLYFLCLIGWEVFGSAFGLHNPKLANFFKYGALVAVGFNVVSNFFYGSLPSGLWGQLAFAVITSFGSGFFPLVGTYLIERSVTK